GWVKVANALRGRIADPDSDRDGSAAYEAQARAFVRERLPGLAEAPILGSRSCLYDNTPDHDFVVDWAPGSSRVLVAGGGSGHGFKFGGSIGPVIADALEEKENALGAAFPLSATWPAVGPTTRPPHEASEGGAMCLHMFGAQFLHAHDGQEIRGDAAAHAVLEAAMEPLGDVVDAFLAAPPKPGETALRVVP